MTSIAGAYSDTCSLGRGTAASELVAMAEELVELRDRETQWKEWIEGVAMLGRVYLEAGDKQRASQMGGLVYQEAIERKDWELKARVEAFAEAHGVPSETKELEQWLNEP